jgi:hypothetical protein
VTGMHTIGDHIRVAVFPNPVIDYIHIQMNLNSPETIYYEMISSSGKIMLNKKLTGALEYNEVIETIAIPKGLYYIRFYGKDWKFTEKIIIQ